MLDIAKYFSVPLSNMGALGEARMEGIYIPEQDIDKEKVGITEQFLENAAVYHEKYTNTAYFSALIRNALNEAGLDHDISDILDIGSGSGNTVFPCLEIFPNASIVSTDLSQNLLAIMKMHADTTPSWQERLSYVCMDATNDYFCHGSFDLVIGAAILHHLLDPVKAMHAAHRALRPGGIAIFFEPFENGNAILELAYREILANVESKGQNGDQDQAVVSFLERFISDYEVRRNVDKLSDIFTEMDDKWLFTKSYFERVYKDIGFSGLTMYPLHDLEKPFIEQTKTNLKLGSGLEPSALSPWAWDILRRYEHAFSQDMKRDLLIEGAIVFRR